MDIKITMRKILFTAFMTISGLAFAQNPHYGTVANYNRLRALTDTLHVDSLLNVRNGIQLGDVYFNGVDGTAGQVLETDGNGNLTFGTVSGGSSSGTGAEGTDGNIQFNEGDTLQASAQLNWDGTNFQTNNVQPVSTSSGFTIKNQAGTGILTMGSGSSSSTNSSWTGNTNITGNWDVSGLIESDNLRLDGNTISSLNTNGNVIIDPNGTGKLEIEAQTELNGNVTQNEGSGSGATPNSSLDNFVIDSDESAGISVLTPNNAFGFFAFGDIDDSFIGGIRYNHSSDELNIVGNDITALKIDSVGNGNFTEDLIVSGIAGTGTRLTQVNPVGQLERSTVEISGSNVTFKGNITQQTGAGSGATPNSLLNDFVIDSDESAGISVLTPNNAFGFFAFGDIDDNYVGGIRYNHSSDELNIVGNNTERLTINSSGVVSLNNYGSGTNTGTATYDLSVDASGNIIEEPHFSITNDTNNRVLTANGTGGANAEVNLTFDGGLLTVNSQVLFSNSITAGNGFVLSNNQASFSGNSFQVNNTGGTGGRLMNLRAFGADRFYVEGDGDVLATGKMTINNNLPELRLSESDASRVFSVQQTGGNFRIRDETAALIGLQVAGGTGDVTITQDLQVSGTLDSDGSYAATTTNAPNMHIASDGSIIRSTADVRTGTVAVANGGTGRSSLDLNEVLVGNGTGSVQSINNGSAGQVLTSNGASSLPSFQTISTVTEVSAGSYIPTFESGTGTLTGATYTVQDGYYSRVGDQVVYSFNVRISGYSSASGDIEISLPVAASGSSNATGTALVSTSSASSTMNAIFSLQIAGGALILKRSSINDGANIPGGTPWSAVGSSNNLQVIGSIVYNR